MVKIEFNIEDYAKEEIILKKKIQLEGIKRNIGKISEEQANNKIVAMQQELSDNKEYKQSEVEWLAEEKFEYEKRNLYYQRNNGQISDDELKDKLNILEKVKGMLPDEKEFDEILNNLVRKYVVSPKQAQTYRNKSNTEKYPTYEREVSSRDEFIDEDVFEWEQKEKQNINKSHKDQAYFFTIDYDQKKQMYGFEVPEGHNYLEYVGTKLGEDYARGLSEEKADLAKQFAKLEVRGMNGRFKNPYESNDEIDGYDNPKSLLQLEKVKGLTIDGFENTRKMDELRDDIYIATYEIEDCGIMKPIKEYYQQTKNGKMKKTSSRNEIKI